MNGKWYIKWDSFYPWKTIQDRAKLKQDLQYLYAEELLVWLRNADLAAIREKAKKKKPLRKLYLKFSENLPESLYVTIQKMLLNRY